ncbi:DUF1350 family protein [Anthocerotibacter panamensis]|uniref:DUF1350 family protein n=1 Tax=Anthocerotibacter panamensis TaxID=2857077 RepID=UPI001C403473|nr:DUF1350 family protein [Anthocerotibacter panamensis]
MQGAVLCLVPDWIGGGNLAKKPCLLKPIYHSWIAIHPQPKGIIQFIGGAFFGSFPTFFYTYLLEKLYEGGYTVIAYPYQFTFDHWPVAIDLLREQYLVREAIIYEIIAHAREYGLDPEPLLAPYLKESNFFWLGHSLGCKYIMLLEILSSHRSSEKFLEELQEFVTCKIDQKQIQQILSAVEPLDRARINVEQSLSRVLKRPISLSKLFITDQSSVLMAPDIADTSSAIPIPSLAKLMDALGLGVVPTKAQTKCLIEQDSYFNLSSLVAFADDTIAGSLTAQGSDVAWFAGELSEDKAFKPLIKELPGEHLAPLGFGFGDYVVNFLGTWLQKETERPLEPVVLDFLAILAARTRLF